MLHCSSSCLFVNKVLVKKSIIGWLPHLKIFRYSCLILPMSKNCHLRKGRQLTNNTTSILAVFLNDFFQHLKNQKGNFWISYLFNEKFLGILHHFSSMVMQISLHDRNSNNYVSSLCMGATPSKVEKGATNGEGAPPYKHDKLAPFAPLFRLLTKLGTECSLNIVFFLKMFWFFWTLQVLLQRWWLTFHCAHTHSDTEGKPREPRVQNMF